MNVPHFFCWAGGVINLGEIESARITKDQIAVRFRSGREVSLGASEMDRDEIGEFMLMCARYHHFDRKEAFPR